MKTVVALAGEGIGVEVVEATCDVLSAAGMPVKILTPLEVETPAGAPGPRVPDETRRACREADAVLFGAAGPKTSAVVGWGCAGRLTGKPGAVMGQGIFLACNAPFGTLEAVKGASPMLLLGDFTDMARPSSTTRPTRRGRASTATTICAT